MLSSDEHQNVKTNGNVFNESMQPGISIVADHAWAYLTLA